MPNHLERYEGIFAAMAFAEMREHDTALQLSGASSEKRNKFASLFQYLQNLYAAAAFTDLFCHEMALDMVREPKAGRTVAKPFVRFLEEIGIRDVRFYYVMARIP